MLFCLFSFPYFWRRDAKLVFESLPEISCVAEVCRDCDLVGAVFAVFWLLMDALPSPL